MKGHKYKSPHKRAKLRKQVFADRYNDQGKKVYSGNICHLCGKFIDITLPAGLPGSPEMDDIIPVSQNGNPLDINNLAPSHRRCNQMRSNLPLDAAIRALNVKRRTSRAW